MRFLISDSDEVNHMKQHADYLLLGGTVIDPVCERSFRADVAVGGGKILAIGADLLYYSRSHRHALPLLSDFPLCA